MHKYRAFTEIEKVMFSKEWEEKPISEKRKRIEAILDETSDHHYSAGKRNGMFKAVNLLTEFAEKENKPEEL